MAFNFPDSPTVGQTYPVVPVSGQPQYTWDGEKWTIGVSMAPDLVAPVISAVGDQTGPTTASYVVTTDENNGTIFWMVSPTAAPFPTPAQIIAGLTGSGAPASDSGSQSVFGVGPQVAMTPNGLVASTAYDFYVLHRDLALNISNIATDEFTTMSVDTTGPTIVTRSPLDNATGVSVLTSLLISWSEPVFAPAPAGTSVHVHRVSDGVTVQTWGTADLGTKWTISGTGTAFTFDAPLTAGTEYYVIVGGFSVQDAAGNGSAAYLSTTAWTFTTLAIAAPSLSLYLGDDTGTPGDHSTSVENPQLDVNFNGVTTVPGGKLYIRTNGVIESMGGLGYHELTVPEAGGANIILTGMTGLTAPGVYNIEAKYETSAWGTVYTLTIVVAAPSNTFLTNLVSYWKLDEASGSAIDAHGSNTLTLLGGAVGTGGSLMGGTMRSLEADNLTDGFIIADNASMSCGDIDFAFSIWVVLESDTNYMNILGKWSGPAGYEYGLVYYYTDGKMRWSASPDGTTPTSMISTDVLPIGVLTHIVVQHDATNNLLRMTVNDATVTSVAYSAGVFDGTSRFHIGAQDSYYNNAPWDGLVGQGAFWKNRILTGAEITALYNGGAGLPYTSFA